MVEREGDDLRAPSRWPPRLGGRVRAQEGRGHLGHALAVQVRHRVEPGHAAAVEPPLERLAEPPHVRGKSLGDLPARQQHRGVVGKEAPVVLEEPKLQALELTVGREDVHDVHLARGERAIGERVLHHRSTRLRRQAVVAPQPGPAVLALEKARAEGGAQLRMPGEVADGPQAQALGRVAPRTASA